MWRGSLKVVCLHGCEVAHVRWRVERAPHSKEARQMPLERGRITGSFVEALKFFQSIAWLEYIISFTSWQGLTDTADLVVLGAWYGKGKRTGVFGAYLLASYNKDKVRLCLRVGLSSFVRTALSLSGQMPQLQCVTWSSLVQTCLIQH